ncbi:sensor domain-containing diguanylate cyclase [Roseospirillum parvum]|uniref:PAS domain S-box-containing protein/diguanylate cyclase (GGDEF) domain-containing protein n=1 Tax=Roseospirillum parvum TaxID=83401 RepID=A0A1G8EH54_9PROT|nr:diguanylate cyclase [Roseospirillum parvum]SDH69253.1 PAS domain S-box-containing protein/diguanylate cyclase (GGDEF) domain-containing protein [Roseospirillum parvum]
MAEEERLRLVLEATTDGIWDWDLTTDKVIWNDAWFAALGHPPGAFAVTREVWADLMHPDDRPAVLAEVAARLADGAPLSVEFRLRRAGGGWLWTLGRGRVVARDAAGAPTRMVGTHTDISACKRAEATAAASEREKRLILGAISDMVTFYDSPDLVVRWANQAAAESVGRRPEEVIGRTCHAVWADSAEPCAHCPVVTCFDTGRPAETTRATPDGRVWQIRAFPVHDAAEALTGVVELGRDITQTHWLDRALKSGHGNLRAFFNLSRDFLMVLDDSARIIEVNTATVDGLGYPRGALIDRSAFSLIPEARRAEAAHTLEAIMAGTCQECAFPLIAADGRVIPCETRVTRGTWNGRPALFTTTRDLSELTFQREVFEKTFRYNNTLMILSEPETGRFVDVNQALLDTFGLSYQAAIGHTAVELGLLPDVERRQTVIQEALARHAEAPPLEVRHVDRHGAPFIGELRIVPIKGGDRDYLLCMINDVTEQRRLMRRLEHQATHDPLTGLFNRQHAQRVIDGEIRRAQRLVHPASLVMIDVDHFKRVNDRFGHPAGDQVLQEVAARLAERLRETDMLARWGGEEFLILLPGTDRDGARRLAETLRQAVGGAPFGEVGRVTLSLGVSALRPGESVSAWLSRVDVALYEAKHAGRDRTVAV